MEKEKKKNPIDFIWKQLKSIKFAIVILILLGVISIFTIFIQEKFPVTVNTGIEYYKAKLTEGEFKLFNFLGFFDPYHSFWYVILLGLLVLNMIVCTISRLKGVWKSMLRVDLNEDESRLLNFRFNKKKVIKKDLKHINEIILAHFKKKKYTVFQKEHEGKKILFFTRGRWNRLSFPLIHLSIIFICIGGIVGNLAGFKFKKEANIGEVFKAPKRDFFIKVEDTWVDLTDTGQPKDWYSKLTVIKGGKEVKHQTIEVNFPLEFEGLKFFQSAFGTNSGKVKSADIQVNFVNQNEQKIVNLRNGIRENITEGGYQIELKRYLSHFQIGDGKKPFSASRNPVNPAVQISIYNKGQFVEDTWLFLKFPDFHGQSVIEDFKLKFIRYEGENFTVLQIGNDPGEPLLWIGFILLTIGSILGFYMSHRKYWVTLVPEEKGVALYTGANANKNITGLEKDFKKYIRIINKI